MAKNRVTIKKERVALIKEKIAALEAVVPEDLRSIIQMVIDDIRHDDFRIASARCRSIMDKLEGVQVVRRLLCDLLPDLKKELMAKGKL